MKKIISIILACTLMGISIVPGAFAEQNNENCGENITCPYDYKSTIYGEAFVPEYEQVFWYGETPTAPPYDVAFANGATPTAPPYDVAFANGATPTAPAYEAFIPEESTTTVENKKNQNNHENISKINTTEKSKKDNSVKKKEGILSRFSKKKTELQNKISKKIEIARNKIKHVVKICGLVLWGTTSLAIAGCLTYFTYHVVGWK